MSYRMLNRFFALSDELPRNSRLVVIFVIENLIIRSMRETEKERMQKVKRSRRLFTLFLKKHLPLSLRFSSRSQNIRVSHYSKCIFLFSISLSLFFFSFSFLFFLFRKILRRSVEYTREVT